MRNDWQNVKKLKKIGNSINLTNKKPLKINEIFFTVSNVIKYFFRPVLFHISKKRL